MLKEVPFFQAFLLQNAERNFYTLFLYKKIYNLFDIIIIHIICICIVLKNCIIIHFYTSRYIKGNGMEIFFVINFCFFLFFAL